MTHTIEQQLADVREKNTQLEEFNRELQKALAKHGEKVVATYVYDMKRPRARWPAPPDREMPTAELRLETEATHDAALSPPVDSNPWYEKEIKRLQGLVNSYSNGYDAAYKEAMEARQTIAELKLEIDQAGAERKADREDLRTHKQSVKMLNTELTLCHEKINVQRSDIEGFRAEIVRQQDKVKNNIDLKLANDKIKSLEDTIVGQDKFITSLNDQLCKQRDEFHSKLKEKDGMSVGNYIEYSTLKRKYDLLLAHLFSLGQGHSF